MKTGFFKLLYIVLNLNIVLIVFSMNIVSFTDKLWFVLLSFSYSWFFQTNIAPKNQQWCCLEEKTYQEE